MEKITLYIGLNDKDTKTQKIDTYEAIKIIYNLLIAHGIDGATMYNATGIYKHDDGHVVIENTIRCEIIDPAINALTGAIISIKRALNQESIIKQVETITSDFI